MVFPARDYRLYTGEYLASLLASTSADPTASSQLARWLPSIIFLLSAGISFATGTSWGTMAIVMPVAIPLAYGALAPMDVPAWHQHPIAICTVGSVLAGAIFGDHCSPISDTTVLSSQSCGCEHTAHVWTQLPVCRPGGPRFRRLGNGAGRLGRVGLVVAAAGSAGPGGLCCSCWAAPTDEAEIVPTRGPTGRWSIRPEDVTCRGMQAIIEHFRNRERTGEKGRSRRRHVLAPSTTPAIPPLPFFQPTSRATPCPRKYKGSSRPTLSPWTVGATSTKRNCDGTSTG